MFRLLRVAVIVSAWGCALSGCRPPSWSLNSTSPEATKAALVEASNLIRNNGTHEQIQAAFGRARNAFPLIQPAHSGRPASWQRLTLNSEGVGLGGVRFISPLEQPADLVWSFAYEGDTVSGWHIEPTSGVITDFSEFERLRDLSVADAVLPATNSVVLQRLPGGQIEPGREYFLWFQFSSTEPADLSFKLKLVAAGEAPQSSASQIASMLDFKLPFQFSTRTNLPIGMPSDAEIDAALDAHRATLGSANSRMLRLLRVQVIHQRTMRMVRDGKRDEVGPLVLEAAEHLRKFRDDFPDLKPHERSVMATVFYNEACTFAIDGEPEKAFASLHEAIEAGFSNVDHLQVDEDFESIRDQPEFKEIVERMRAAANAATDSPAAAPSGEQPPPAVPTTEPPAPPAQDAPSNDASPGGTSSNGGSPGDAGPVDESAASDPAEAGSASSESSSASFAASPVGV